MEYTQLGRTGLKVSRLCLGTMNVGPQISEADAFAIMDQALGLGINFIDTANVYGRQMGKGFSEQVIGPRTVEQLTGSLRALDIQFSKTEMTKLDGIWPGPGAAPEAYAW